MKQITAVDYLVERILKHDKSFLDFYKAEITEVKQKEKQQIMDAYWDGGQDVPISEIRCEQYYKENYEKE